MRVNTGVAGLVAAACAGVLLTASPTTAAPRATTGPHCVAQAATGETTCYDTFRESIAAATGGRITDAPATPQEAAADKKFLDKMNVRLKSTDDASASNRTNPIGPKPFHGAILYEHSHQGGRSLTLRTADTEACMNDGRWDGQGGRLADHGFNDLTSSVFVSRDCLLELYASNNFRGIRNLYDTTEWIGEAMNDQASSYRLKARGEVIH
ncbi:hypothetical protein ABT354_32900 [Streptomyces sp. NPDC000594]|uniref:hypothetical protein n=1 Tax=Streptomyces sp. NPDC000594 TaxID=3154261 RepID=UPI00332EC94E